MKTGAINGRLIALDGPCNGQWIDGQTAFANGYDIHRWETGELVWAIGDPTEVPAELQEREPLTIQKVTVAIQVQRPVEDVDITIAVPERDRELVPA